MSREGIVADRGDLNSIQHQRIGIHTFILAYMNFFFGNYHRNSVKLVVSFDFFKDWITFLRVSNIHVENFSEA